MLQGGKWGDRQIVSARWISQMSMKQVDSAPAGINATQLDKETADPDWIQGYGYQDWMCRHNAYRADGARTVHHRYARPECGGGDDCRHSPYAGRAQPRLEIRVASA